MYRIAERRRYSCYFKAVAAQRASTDTKRQISNAALGKISAAKNQRCESLASASPP
jgi:hypothetical protein